MEDSLLVLGRIFSGQEGRLLQFTIEVHVLGDELVSLDINLVGLLCAKDTFKSLDSDIESAALVVAKHHL